MRNSWDWNVVVDKECWLEPSDEGYYYAVKWSREGKNVILDLGCGLGRHSILFDSYGFHVMAVDSSVEAIDFLREYSSKEGLDIECDVADMHDLPYADDTFDCIFAYLSVSHTDSKGILKVMSEIRRVLKTGGSIFFTLCSKDTGRIEIPDMRESMITLSLNQADLKKGYLIYMSISMISKI